MQTYLIYTLIAAVILLVVTLYCVGIYNTLILFQNNTKQSFANIDVLLVQRHDELPKLVETCKQYMGFEQKTLVDVMDARSKAYQARQSGDIKAMGAAEGALQTGLGALMATVENYPDLKANEDFQKLQERITGLETDIAEKRSDYNDTAKRYNVQIAQFPPVIVARMCNFKEADLLHFDKATTSDVDLKGMFA